MAGSSTRALIRSAESALEKGDVKQTVAYCKEVLRTQPAHARALGVMGHAYQAAGNMPTASQLYQQAINADPTSVEFYIELSRTLAAQNMPNEAVQIALAATKQAPNDPLAHSALVKLLLRFNSAHKALDYLESMPDRIKTDADLWQYYCFTLKLNEMNEKADVQYQELLRTFPHKVSASFRLMYETHLPRVLLDSEKLDKVRAAFEATLDRFIEQKPALDLFKLTYQPLFYLAFHNRDNKAFAQKYCRMLRTLAPRELNYVASHCKTEPVYEEGRPIRIGFCSRHMHEHAVGRCYRNIVLHLHRDPRFKVTLFAHHQIMDAKMNELVAAGIEIVPLPKNVLGAQQIIAHRELNILIYPDIGMEIDTYYLALARLAHYQCCLSGHPDTTGIDTIDYFISSRLYEPSHGNENYIETLLVHDGLDTLTERPSPPAQWLDRATLGLPIDKKLYVCPMAIQKIHPDFDAVMGDILKKDPNGMLVLFNDFQLKSASDRFRERILQQCDPSRVLFLDWQTEERLFSIMKAADAVLVTIYFGAGTTAQYATAFGIPMVSMPGDHTRSRVLHGYYTLMQIEDAPLAKSLDAYADIAVRLANDRAYYDRISAQLRERNRLLFEDNDYGPRAVELMCDIMKQDLAKYQL